MQIAARTGRLPVLFSRHVLWSLVALAIVAPTTARGQLSVRSWLQWRTIETPHFAFHYPTELEEWTRSVASRAEAIDSAVARVVGYAPSAKTQIVVDDPFESPNGSAWPYVNQPVINLWATPPSPRDDIGEFRAWSEMLLSHEFTHIAHLARPSRNAFTRRLWQALAVNIGPIALRAPRWAIEGYATLVEGQITGSGRPHGVWRAAFLRQWALEGQLARYDQLDAGAGYEGGEFAYLAGSAFLEWLVARNGDSSLVHVWRRLSARQNRTFDDAFAGEFGESPRALYGRFSAELTGKALDAQRALLAAGADTGAIVQRLARQTGDPSISHDGQRVALIVRSATAPSRVVIWKTAPEPDTMKTRRDSLLLAKDPDDIPAKPIYPPPKKELVTLRAAGGSSYETPRFLRDGRVLLSRNTAQGDGSLRPDLYLWDPEHHSVRRVTRGASLREADPSPDGRTAVAAHCHSGWCDVVVVNLADGSYTTLLRGSPTRSFYRPRYSPDGSRLLVSVHEGHGWRLAIAPLPATTLSLLAPSAGNVYDGEWIDSTTLVAVWDGDGIPNLQRIDLRTNDVRPLTRVTGSAVAPAPNPADGSIWFLSLYSRGYDVRRVNRTPTALARALNDTSKAPAISLPPIDLAPFGLNAVSDPHRFDMSARLFRWLPQPQVDADGFSGALALMSSDIIGRSELLANLSTGDRAAWRGGSVSATWRGTRPSFRLQVFGAEQRPSATRSNIAPATDLDVRLTGAQLTLEDTRQYDTWAARLRLGASAGEIRQYPLTDSSAGVRAGVRSSARPMLFGSGAIAWTQRGDATSITETLGSNFTAGRSFDTRFYRGVASAAVAIGGQTALPITATALYGRTNTDAAPFEQFALGGGPSVLLDGAQLTQRVGMPALPTGISNGSSVFAYRVTLVGQTVSPYFWAGSAATAGERFATWQRVLGLEWSESIAAVTLAGTPAARAQIGIGESLDRPFAHRVRAYVSLVLNP